MFLAIASLGLVSCNSNDDETGIVIDGIDLTSDVDCCSAEEALQVYRFIQTVHIIPELRTEVDGKYNVYQCPGRILSADMILHIDFGDGMYAYLEDSYENH